jgi:DNA-binding NarL/FixJ family response regulator
MSKYKKHTQRVLIVSGHPLFGEGLRSLLENRWGKRVDIVGLVSSVDQTVQALTHLKPDLIIVDYDDDHLNREEILGQFIKGKQEIRLVLLSLKDGAEGAEAIVYDRKNLSASKIEDWLEIDSTATQIGRGENQ